MGMTGVNLTQAKADLDNFKYASDDVVDKLAVASMEFCIEIVHNWSSPNAVAFAKNYRTKLIDIHVKPMQDFNSIVWDAAKAINSMAMANGASFNVQDYDSPPTTMMYSQSMLDDVVEVAPDGTTGMNINAIKNALNTFSTQTKDAIGMMGSLPKDIALYDDNGELLASFNSRISSAKSSVESIVNEVSSSLNESMQTETNAVITGVSTAIDDFM